MAHCKLFVAALILAFFFAPAASQAQRLVWARAGDTATLDPHEQNNGSTQAFNHQIYEPLLIRDARGKLRPALATSWQLSEDPKFWIFHLRKNVTFHDGSPLTASDVIFSLERAKNSSQDIRDRLDSIAAVIKLDPHTVQIETKGRNPLLPIQLTDVFIMSAAWANTHSKVMLQAGGDPNVKRYATTHANGTGPFVLVKRTPGKETILKRNPGYWDTAPEISELIYRVIPAPEDRVRALISGEIDFLQDVPIKSFKMLSQSPNLTLKTGPENRVIMLGLNTTSMRRHAPDAGRPNPLADRHVRHAIDIALDRRAIQRDVMQGQSIPTGVPAPPTINGYPLKLDHVRQPDPAGARNLLAKAGYKSGFAISLDCPNHLYINSAKICHAIAKQLETVGINVTVNLHAKAVHLPLIRNQQSDFFLLGWSVPTFDSVHIFRHLYRTKPPGVTTWNGTGFSNEIIDQLIDSLDRETDHLKRDQTISDIWWRAHSERIYIPLHVETLAYAMRKGISIDVDISDAPKLKFARIERAQGTPSIPKNQSAPSKNIPIPN